MKKKIFTVLAMVCIGYHVYVSNKLQEDVTIVAEKQINDAVLEMMAPRPDSLRLEKNQPKKKVSARMAETKLDRDIATCIAHVEGFSAEPYFSGAWCIGYGSTVYSDGTPVAQNSRCVSKEEAQKCLIAHLRKVAYPTIDRLVKRELTEGQYITCAMFIYNLGDGAFAKSSFLKALNGGESVKVCVEKLAAYNKVGGKVSPALQKRRWLEGAIFSGIITAEDIRKLKISVYNSNLAQIYVGGRPDYSAKAVGFLKKTL